MDFVDQRDQHVDGKGEIEPAPILFPFIGDFDVGDRGTRRIMRVRVVDDLQR